MALSPRLTLIALGLTVDEVRAQTAQYRIDTMNSDPEYLCQDHRNGDYLAAEDQRRAQRRLASHTPWMKELYAQGYRPRHIAYFLACSEEAVRRRLREAALIQKSVDAA